ncbi:MAG: hypothetical protein WC481_06825 [Candidatus Omnitrophota bacterium]
MKPLRFYEHFACGYGTIWLMLLFVSLITQQHIDTGWSGLVVFPIIALIYAFVRKSSEEKESKIIAQITKKDVRCYLKKALRIDLLVIGILFIGYLTWILYVNWINHFSGICDTPAMTNFIVSSILLLLKYFIYFYVPCLLFAIGIEWYRSLPEKK